MPKIVAAVIEITVLVCVFWLISFLSTLLHELGHALGYVLATRDGHWHIRCGWGKRLLHTKALTVNLLVFDGCFIPAENKLNTKAKRILMLAGGPFVSLLLTAGLAFMKIGGFSLHSDILADGVAEYLVNYALFLNLFILLLSVIPIHYFHGKNKGLPSDGLQIIQIIREHKASPHK